jgi:hypothetical protein
VDRIGYRAGGIHRRRHRCGGQYWPMFWVAVALAAVALIATVVLQRMGYGAS